MRLFGLRNSGHNKVAPKQTRSKNVRTDGAPSSRRATQRAGWPGAADGTSRVAVKDLNQAYRQLNTELNQSLGSWGRNGARVLTQVGTIASLAGGGAAAGALLAGGVGALSGIGLPHGAIAAIVGASIAVAGISLSIAAGALLRRMHRKTLQNNPQFQDRIAVLQEIDQALTAKKKSGEALTVGEKKLLRNTYLLRKKVDPSFQYSLRKQFGNALTAPIKLLGIFGMGLNIVHPFPAQWFEAGDGKAIRNEIVDDIDSRDARGKLFKGNDKHVDLSKYDDQQWLARLGMTPSLVPQQEMYG